MFLDCTFDENSDVTSCGEIHVLFTKGPLLELFISEPRFIGIPSVAAVHCSLLGTVSVGNSSSARFCLRLAI